MTVGRLLTVETLPDGATLIRGFGLLGVFAPDERWVSKDPAGRGILVASGGLGAALDRLRDAGYQLTTGRTDGPSSTKKNKPTPRLAAAPNPPECAECTRPVAEPYGDHCPHCETPLIVVQYRSTGGRDQCTVLHPEGASVPPCPPPPSGFASWKDVAFANMRAALAHVRLPVDVTEGAARDLANEQLALDAGVDAAAAARPPVTMTPRQLAAHMSGEFRAAHPELFTTTDTTPTDPEDSP